MIQTHLQALKSLNPNSHKGQNGKLLIIAGSELFHAPLIWSAEIASRLVDMVHVCSPETANNDLMTYRLKQQFWNGIVINWDHLNDYLAEDDSILIGPGMTRTSETAKITNQLLKKYPDKTWVVDGGALQMVDPTLLDGSMIITPHQGEWECLLNKIPGDWSLVPRDQALITRYSKQHNDVVVLLKGPTDYVVRGDQVEEITGGNAGMTKGGTGDVLAGLVAALSAANDHFIAAKAASAINKLAGDALYAEVGPNFNASDLIAKIPQVLQQYSNR